MILNERFLITENRHAIERNKLPRRKRTGYQSENYDRPKGRGIKPSSAAGGLNRCKPRDQEYRRISWINIVLPAIDKSSRRNYNTAIV